MVEITAEESRVLMMKYDPVLSDSKALISKRYKITD